MPGIQIQGRVKPGRQQGRKIGFPTINLPVPKNVKADAWGIYFSLSSIGQRLYAGVTHLGPPIAFGIKKPTCETFLLRYRGDSLTGKTVKLRLLAKHREIEDFPNVKQLKLKIRKDVRAAKKYFHQVSKK